MKKIVSLAVASLFCFSSVAFGMDLNFDHLKDSPKAKKMQAHAKDLENAMHKGDAKKALKVADKAIAEHPDSHLGYQMKSQAHALEGKKDEAVAALKEAASKAQDPAERAKLEEKTKNVSYYMNSANPVINAWSKDRAKAKKKYGNKTVVVAGIVTKIANDGAGEPYIMLGTDQKDADKGIMASFVSAAGGSAAVSDLKVGDKVAVSGLCMDIVFGKLVLSNCKVVK